MNTLNQLLSKLTELLTWWVILEPWEEGIRIRLGKHVKHVGPGITLRIPWFDHAYVQSTRTRTSDFDGVQTISTADGHILTVSGNVKYRITDVFKLYMTLHHAEDTIVDMVMSAVADYVVARNRSEVTPAGLTEYVRQTVSLTNYGLSDVQINITDFAFAKAYRLIQGSKRFSTADGLETSSWRAAPSAQPY